MYEIKLRISKRCVKGPMSHKETGFAISDSIHAAWHLFKEKWYVIYGLYLIPVVLGFVYTMMLENLGNEFSGPVLLLFFAYLVVQTVLSMGLIKGYLNLVRGEAITVQTFKDMLPLVVNYILGTLLMALIVVVGFVLLIIPGMYFSLKYYFVPFLLIDKKMSPMEALKASEKMTDGIKWEMLGLFATTVLLAYLGIFALIVGVFVTAPVAGMSYVYFYEKALKRLA